MKYQNPIIKGFNPDPSICRVGEDYYLVTSSFEYVPGIPIYHSKDLVNWKQIGNCLNCPIQLPMEHTKDSGGVWAPTIRYWKGRFYVTATLDEYGNFIVSTEDIVSGWSSPLKVNMDGIDPSLYFKDDKAYYCTNQTTHPGKEEISLAEINLHTGELCSEQKKLWGGLGGGFLEAPHLYLINDWYYLMAAEGGTNFSHMITVARSKDLWGPYESCPFNPILTNLHDTARQVQCAGHGDLFQDHLGNWWMVHLAIRTARRTMSHLGRETFLTPIFWKNEWPVADQDKKAKLEVNGPLWEEQQITHEWKADFKREEWEPEWIFLRDFQDNIYEKKDGKLKIHPISAKFTDRETSALAAVRPLDFNCSAETSFTFFPEEIGDEAGIAIYLSSDFHYRIGKQRTEQGDFIIVEKHAEDFSSTVFRQKAEAGDIRLKVIADKEFYNFYYVIGEGSLGFAAKASTRFLSTEVAGKCFTGTIIGMYAFAKAETKATAEFKTFVIRKEREISCQEQNKPS